MSKWLCLILVGILGGWLVAGTSVAEEAESAAGGVVVHGVTTGSAFAEAGIEMHDVILAWRRLPSPANPEEAGGEIRSSFDYMWLALEQAPRGEVELTVERDGEVRFVRVAGGEWVGLRLPHMPDPLLEGYLRGKVFLDAAVAERLWMEVAEDADDWRLRCSMHMILGTMQEDWEKAHAAFRAALQVAEESFPRSVIWRMIGSRQERRGELDLAWQAYDTARELREESDGESLVLAESLIDLANLLSDRKYMAQAADYYRRALEIHKRLVPRSPRIAVLLENLGAIASHGGDLRRARELLLDAQEMKRRAAPEDAAPEDADDAATLTSLGSVAADRGDLEQATEYHLRALAIKQRQSSDSRSIAISLNNLGTVALRRGELDEAAGYLQRALEIWQRAAPGSLDLASTLNNLGSLADDRGDFEQAWGHYQQALEIRQKLVAGSLDHAGTLNSLGVLAFRRGDLAWAKDHLERALEIRQRSGGKLIQAATLSNLGSVALIAEELVEAEDFFQRALEIYRQLAPDSLDLASVLGNLGSLALGQGDLDQAVGLHQRSLEIEQEKAPVSSGVAESLSVLGVVAQQRGAFKQAENLYQRSLETWQRVAPDSTHVAALYFMLGFLYTQADPPRRVAADRFMRRALDAMETQLSRFGGSHDTRAGFRADFDYQYRLALENQLALNRPRAAFHTLERARARSFLEHVAERDIVFTADIPRALDQRRREIAVRFDRAQQALAGLSELEHAAQIAALRQEQRRLRDEAGDIEEEIRAASSKLAALHYPEPLDFEAARSALDPGTLLLSYSVGEKVTSLFLISRDQPIEVVRLPAGREALETYVTALLDHLAQAGSGSALAAKRLRQFQQISRALYATLLKPAEEQIGASRRLLILPDGPLHALPFAALLRRGTFAAESYLVEWKPIHVAQSATVYRQLTQRRRDGSEGAGSFVAFGDPRYPRSLSAGDRRAAPADGELRSVVERGTFDWQALPYTRSEVEAIADLFPQEQVRTFLGTEALEERIKSLDRETRILHLAAHAFTDQELPSSSFVALTIPDEVVAGERPTALDNGLLQVWEIFERVRIDADLVVLSACESGLGQELGGEGLIGLTRAFQYAGARSVVASLWSVADQTTAELMVHFYRHLRSGLPKDEALRAAQLELIRAPIEVVDGQGQAVQKDASAPYYWAAFQVYGDWQ